MIYLYQPAGGTTYLDTMDELEVFQGKEEMFESIVKWQSNVKEKYIKESLIISETGFDDTRKGWRNVKNVLAKEVKGSYYTIVYDYPSIVGYCVEANLSKEQITELRKRFNTIRELRDSIQKWIFSLDPLKNKSMFPEGYIEWLSKQ